MIILALDTAAADCSACVFDMAENQVLGRVVETIGKGHAERLMDIIDRALGEAAVDVTQLDRIAVNIGPGSFTGVRVGVATARALALATNAHCVGISSLRAIASQHRRLHPQTPVLATIDARRGEAYAQVFDADGNALCDAAAEPYEALAQLAARYQAIAVGSGAETAGIGVASAEDLVRVETLAHLAGATEPGAPVSPLYLRAPDAKPQAGFTLSRA